MACAGKPDQARRQQKQSAARGRSGGMIPATNDIRSGRAEETLKVLLTRKVTLAARILDARR